MGEANFVGCGNVRPLGAEDWWFVVGIERKVKIQKDAWTPAVICGRYATMFGEEGGPNTPQLVCPKCWVEHGFVW